MKFNHQWIYRNYNEEDFSTYDEGFDTFDEFQKDDLHIDEDFLCSKPNHDLPKYLLNHMPLDTYSLLLELDRLCQVESSNTEPSSFEMELLLRIVLSHLYFLRTNLDKILHCLQKKYDELSLNQNNSMNSATHKEFSKSSLYRYQKRTSQPHKIQDKTSKNYDTKKIIRQLIEDLLNAYPDKINIELENYQNPEKGFIRSFFTGLRLNGVISIEKHSLTCIEGVSIVNSGKEYLEELLKTLKGKTIRLDSFKKIKGV